MNKNKCIVCNITRYNITFHGGINSGNDVIQTKIFETILYVK